MHWKKHRDDTSMKVALLGNIPNLHLVLNVKLRM